MNILLEIVRWRFLALQVSAPLRWVRTLNIMISGCAIRWVVIIGRTSPSEVEVAVQIDPEALTPVWGSKTVLPPHSLLCQKTKKDQQLRNISDSNILIKKLEHGAYFQKRVQGSTQQINSLLLLKPKMYINSTKFSGHLRNLTLHFQCFLQPCPAVYKVYSSRDYDVERDWVEAGNCNLDKIVHYMLGQHRKW